MLFVQMLFSLLWFSLDTTFPLKFFLWTLIWTLWPLTVLPSPPVYSFSLVLLSLLNWNDVSPSWDFKFLGDFKFIVLMIYVLSVLHKMEVKREVIGISRLKHLAVWCWVHISRLTEQVLLGGSSDRSGVRRPWKEKNLGSKDDLVWIMVCLEI